MKKLALTFLTLTIITGASAQVPQALNYQAIARNSLGQIVPSQNINVRFTILDGSGNTVFYQETHSATTNNFGLFTLAIGKGTAVSGSIPSIDWSIGGDKYLKVEIAPQGGTNYTIQGATQLLSVPYALFAEKTKLIGGNAITITNGNTINANYIAGPGITISGNTISATAGNSWLLNGNAATASSNFLGTTDNLPLNIRTNNLQRLSISESNIVGSNNISYISAGQQSNFSTNPVQLSVYGKDISGFMLPFGVATNIAGMNFDPTGGSNNTLGRQVRWSQWSNNSNYLFYDQGIDQEGDYYITEQGLSGTGGAFPKKMLQITAADNVGINMSWAENPTANFHTKGTVRLEGITTNNAFTRILAMDANGNVASRDASTLIGSSNDWSLTGNSGTTAANFLGTTDNVRLNFRTNNTTRMYVDQPVTAFGADIGYISISDEANVQARPTQLSIFGRDIAGASLPMLFTSYVGGATWGIGGGNTLGRFFRLTQMTTTFVQSHFYDVGMSRDSSFYITNHGFQNVGGIMPKKMFTISAQDMIGINLDMSEKPTAVLHTKGSLRFQNINTDNSYSRILAMDINGNVASRDASTLSGNDWALLGNSGTTSLNFLGTINNASLRFRTFNQERMIIDSTGNVGIGTSAPNYSLSIQGQYNSVGPIDKRFLISLNNTSTSTDAVTGIRLEANGGANSPTNFGMLAMTSPAYNIVPANINSLSLVTYTRGGLSLVSAPYNTVYGAYGKIKFFTGTGVGTQAIERMRIDSTGNVGVGTSAPDYLLSIQGQYNSSGPIDKRYLLSLNNTSNNNDAVTGIRLEANAGATNPSNFGSLTMNSPAYNIIPALVNSLNLVSYTRQGLNLIATQAGGSNATYGKIRFFIGTDGSNQNIERMRIDSTGFVGVNTQVPTANFHTNGTLRFENISTNNALSRLVAMDANGNVSSRDASTLLQWTPDVNGIHYSSGNAGVGINSRNDASFSVGGTSALPWTVDINSTYDWQTAVNLKNSTSNSWFQFVVGGSANTFTNYGVGNGNFGIVRALPSGVSTIPIVITQNDFVGIGSDNGGSDNTPKARLHVKSGDVYIDQIGSGVIMKSPNGQCWRMTVSNAGTPVFTAIPCP